VCDIPMFFDSKTYSCSHSVVSVILFIILNHSMGIYAILLNVFGWSSDYKSVALPIEL